MKKNIHPNYYPQAKVACACGNTFTIGSTQKSITVDVCDKCHPFFTGELRFADTKGKIDAFLKKRAAADTHKKKVAKNKDKKEQEHKSLKEMLTVTKLNK